MTALMLSSLLAKDRDIVIKCTIDKGKDIFSFPSTATIQGKEVTLKATRDLHVPSQWALPEESVNSEGQTIMMPVTPTAFETVDAGWIIHCRPEEMDKGLIRLSGVITFSQPELAQAVHGEYAGPIFSKANKEILLTENKAESAITLSSTTRFQLFAEPGKQYKFSVRKLNKTVPIVLNCDFKK